MVAKVRRADGSHLIDAGRTPEDIEAQGSADQAAVGYENFRSFIRRVLLASVSKILASGAVAGLVQFDGVPKNFGEG